MYSCNILQSYLRFNLALCDDCKACIAKNFMHMQLLILDNFITFSDHMHVHHDVIIFSTCAVYSKGFLGKSSVLKNKPHYGIL